MPLSPEQLRQQAQMREVLPEIANGYLVRPGVNGMGIGFKQVGGEETNVLSFRVYVDEKKKVPDAEMIPHDVRGFPTDVIEFAPSRRLPSSQAPPRPDDDDEEEPGDLSALEAVDPKNKQDPLVGGISIGPSRNIDGASYVGTLGLMVVDTSVGLPVMLSNYHVMCLDDGKAKKGDTICQPSRVDRALDWCSNCAELERWFLGDYSNLGGVDAAVARLTHRTATFSWILNVPTGSPQQVRGISKAQIDDPVYKCGRTTSLTESKIEDVDGVFQSDFGPPYDSVTLTKMVVARNVAPNKFTEPGDSGSVYVNKSTNTVVALHSAGGPTRSLGCPIAAVVGALNITIP